MTYKVPKTLYGPNAFRARVQHCGVVTNAENCRGFIIELLDDNQQHYRIAWPMAKPDPLQVAKALLFFRHDARWRKHFMCGPQIPIWGQNCTANSLEAYDPLANTYFKTLDLKVMRFQKGGDDPLGHACELRIYGRFPGNILEIANRNSWRISDNHIRINAPRGFSHLSREMFILLLDDWAMNCLDTSGVRYQIKRQAEPWFPAWPTYPESALAENEKANRLKAEKVNALSSTQVFDEYVKLTSGRDTFSTMPLNELIQLVGEQDEALQCLNEVASNPTLMAKALRWRLRGLNVMHTMEKYRVDELLHTHAEKDREARRQRRLEELSALDDFPW
jgi:hypothetical protein